MAEEQDMELTSSHRYIKNTSTSGTICTENLNTGLRLLKGQENLHITRSDKRKRKTERNQDRTCAAGREL